jgi:hypothetical protein
MIVFITIQYMFNPNTSIRGFCAKVFDGIYSIFISIRLIPLKMAVSRSFAIASLPTPASPDAEVATTYEKIINRLRIWM